MSLGADIPHPEAHHSLRRAHEIVDGIGQGFISVSADWRVNDCNAVAERFLHATRDDLLDRKLWEVAGVDRDSPIAELGRRVAKSRRAEEVELVLRRNKRTSLLNVRAFPLGGGVGVIWRDVTRVRAAERRLAESESRYRMLAEGAPAASWISRRNFGLEYINQAMCDALGRSAEELLGHGWIETIDPDDRAGLLLAREQAIANHAAIQYEGRFRDAEGRLRIIQLHGRPRFDASGAFRGHVGNATDVTEVRDAERRQRQLIHELNHRVKNTLAVVQALVRQSLREHHVDKVVEDLITERLIALAAAHDVLNRENWEGAELADIARAAAGPYDGDGRISAAGPRVRLEPKTAIALSMALHELATNAAKHGALSTQDGRVQLTWTAGGNGVVLEWRESGGPRVAAPTETGYGSQLLGRILATEFGQPAVIVYAPEGLVCRITAPAAPPTP